VRLSEGSRFLPHRSRAFGESEDRNASSVKQSDKFRSMPLRYLQRFGFLSHVRTVERRAHLPDQSRSAHRAHYSHFPIKQTILTFTVISCIQDEHLKDPLHRHLSHDSQSLGGRCLNRARELGRARGLRRDMHIKFCTDENCRGTIPGIRYRDQQKVL
jgi:hypothetical protein